MADVKTAWRTALREAGITGLRFHDLRHTAATRLAKAGCDAFTIAALIGHASIETSARYTHVRRTQATGNGSDCEQIGKVGHNTVTMEKRDLNAAPLTLRMD